MSDKTTERAAEEIDSAATKLAQDNIKELLEDDFAVKHIPVDDDNWQDGYINGCIIGARSIQATLSEYKQKVEELEGENERLMGLLPIWVSVHVEPHSDKYYQLAFNDDVYIDVFRWTLLDLSNRAIPCFISVTDNTVMELYEVSHYREINTDAPDWANLQ